MGPCRSARTLFLTSNFVGAGNIDYLCGMKKKTKLKICNWSLIVLTLGILASGIQLEATDSSEVISVWIHIVVGMVFMGLVGYHIYLHFGWSNWFDRFHKLKSQMTRVLWWVSLLTLLSAIIALIHWLTTAVHSPIGGIHGKLGFLMILLAICHIVKRYKFFKLK